MAIWKNLNSYSYHLIKRILSGPVRIGKSYIAWFLAAITYAHNFLIFYIADASDLDCEEIVSQMKICWHFSAFNKVILFSANLSMLVRVVTEDDLDSIMIIRCLSQIYLNLLKQKLPCKTFIIIDKH